MQQLDAPRASARSCQALHKGTHLSFSKYDTFFFPSNLLSLPFYSLSLLVVTQIWGHIAGSSPPLPTTVRALHFYLEKISALSSLVDSRRIVLTHARRSQQLILFFFFTFTYLSPDFFVAFSGSHTGSRVTL